MSVNMQHERLRAFVALADAHPRLRAQVEDVVG